MKLTLSVREGRFAVCRLDPSEGLPEWATRGEIYSVTRAPGEISVVCTERDVPADVVHEGGWACLGVHGPLDFALCGVLASLATPLAAADVPLFALSTHDTDYLLVKHDDLERAVGALTRHGHAVVESK